MAKKMITVSNAQGLHARPASLLVKGASKFQSNIKLSKGDKSVDAKSIISVLSLSVGFEDQIEISADGIDASEAVEAISKMFEEKFGEN